MKKYIILSVVLLLLTASCSTNDDNNNEQREETQGVRFTINEEGFGADTELTRSAVTAQPTAKPKYPLRMHLPRSNLPPAA